MIGKMIMLEDDKQNVAGATIGSAGYNCKMRICQTRLVACDNILASNGFFVCLKRKEARQICSLPSSMGWA
jgi:hypothetical protein